MKDGPTMTVGQLRAAIASYPDDLPVYGLWDTIPHFQLVRVGWFAGAVVLDVESYGRGMEFKRLGEAGHGQLLDATGVSPQDAQLPASLGDCTACDNYVLSASEFPHCPTCARLVREGKPL